VLTEASLIKAFLNYQTWETYSSSLSARDFPDELQFLYRVLDTFHQTNEAHADLHLMDLANLFFSQTKKDKEFYEGVFNTLETYEPNLNTIRQLVVSLRRSRLLREASIVAYEVAEGKKDFTAFEALLGGFAEQPTQEEEEEDEAVTDDICELVAKTYGNPGLRWRLATLNRMLGSLRKGNFGFIFARPETGKTTFLASEITYMAEQLKEGDGPILWLNNEQVHDEVKIRIVQAALGITLEQLMSNKEKWNKAYKEKFGGRILLIHTWNSTKRDTERLCKKYKPSLVVVDQIDKVKGFDADREDLMLGAVYQWFRDLAKIYCPIIGVCQADGSGEGQKWLTMANVANAKTSKQAEADWILGIGAVHDSGWEKVRFLHLSKNKLMGDEDTDPSMRHGKKEVLIQAETARYEDIA
jgi:replicative DNA helicase